MEMLAAKYEKLLWRVALQDTDIEELKMRVDTIEASRSQADDIQCKVNKLEQYGRLSNLELHGISVTENEDL